MANTKYCEVCPRAILCIAREELYSPFATCTKCGEVKEVVCLTTFKPPVYESVGFSMKTFFVTFRELYPQGQRPHSRGLCPRSWSNDMKTNDSTQVDPFVCFRCGGGMSDSRGREFSMGAIYDPNKPVILLPKLP
jgi:hypothetical protein